MSIHSWELLIIDVKTKYIWDYDLETKEQVFEKIQVWLEKEIKLLRGRYPSGYEVVLFSDMREAKSTRVEELCSQYSVQREPTTGYSSAHNAFVERWFRTNAEISRCQMLQYDKDETYWEDSRRMATFIYNRVPPSRKIPGEPWTKPLKKQYPEQRSMDMAKIRPFGIICYVYQKKLIRNKGFNGKSDKKKTAKNVVLVGYEDQLGPERVKVYHPQDNSYQCFFLEIISLL
jgi:hypothetical protein